MRCFKPKVCAGCRGDFIPRSGAQAAGLRLAEAGAGTFDLAAPPDAPPFVPTSDAKRGPGAPDTLIDTTTLLRLSLRFGQDYETASTVDLSTRFEAVCETLGAGHQVVDALLDMASLCTCLADQRAG